MIWNVITVNQTLVHHAMQIFLEISSNARCTLPKNLTMAISVQSAIPVTCFIFSDNQSTHKNKLIMMKHKVVKYSLQSPKIIILLNGEETVSLDWA